jgi:antitoxin VapB
MIAIPQETETLVRLVANKTGRTPEDVVRDAVEASARALGVTGKEADINDREAMIEAANAIARRSAIRPVLDTRSEDDILGYDDHGIPR